MAVKMQRAPFLLQLLICEEEQNWQQKKDANLAGVELVLET